MYRKKEVGYPNLEMRKKKRLPLYTCIAVYSFCCTGSEYSRNHKIKWHFFLGLLLLRNGKTSIKFRSNFLQTFPLSNNQHVRMSFSASLEVII